MNDTSNFYFAFRHEASSSEVLIPYALFATFEMAPKYNIDVYEKVVEKVHIRNKIVAKTE